MQETLAAFYAGEEGLESLKTKVDQRRLDRDSIIEVLDQAPTPEPPAPEPARMVGDHAIGFYPVWSTKGSLVACHFCAPSRCDGGIVRHCHDTLFLKSGRNANDNYGVLDLAILDASVDAIRSMLAAGDQGVVGASVHVSTLRRPKSRAEFIARLGAVPPAVAQRLVIKIAEIEAGTSPTQLFDLTAHLRRFVRQVGLGFHYTDLLLPGLRETGAWSMGFALPQHRTGTTQHLHDLIARWRRAADRAHLRLFVDGVLNRDLFDAASRTGADFMTSEQFWPPLSHAPVRTRSAA